MFYYTEDLVSAIKLSGFVPTGQGTFNDPTDFIWLSNEELQKRLVPHIVKVRQDFFTKHQIVPLVNGVNHYVVPERTIGGTLVDLFYLPSTSDLSKKRPIPKINLHDQQIYATNSYSEVNKFWFEGDEIIVCPTPVNPTGYLMQYFLRKPSKLVPSSQCAQITAISQGSPNTVFTVSNDLTATTPAIRVGSLLDFVASKSPFLCRDIDVPVVAINSTTITVATANIVNEAGTIDQIVGDWICPAQQTNIPQVPDLFHSILSEMVVCRVLRALGHLDKFNTVKAELVESLKDAWAMIENRVESEVDTVYDQNSLLNQVNGWFCWPYNTTVS